LSGGDPSVPNCDLPKDFKPHITWDQQEYITYANVDKVDKLKYSPWRSPGEAPVIDSCGVAAGTTKDNKLAAGVSPPGRKNGFKGTDLPASNLTEWTVGQTVEVAFGLWANHGGGYQYRLCPAGSSLDEDCFKKMPLKHPNNKQKLFWIDGPNKGREEEIEAVRVTARDGSVWTKNPIPAYGCSSGGVEADGQTRENNGCAGPMFTPSIEGSNYWGYGNTNIGSGERYADKDLPHIKDFVAVPDVAPGHYVLSWRWDCEQTPQVWNSCADITISKENSSVHV
jgi:hypothetical protein